MNDEYATRVVCKHCGYEANLPTNRHCEFCGAGLAAGAGFPLGVIAAATALAIIIGGSGWYWITRQSMVRSPIESQQPQPNLSEADDRPAAPPSDPEELATESNPVRLVGNAFSGYSTFRLPEFSAALKELDIEFQYENELDFAVAADRLNQGEADFVATTLDQFVKQQPDGQIVALIDYTLDADAVVLNTLKYKNLTSLENLEKLVEAVDDEGQQLEISYAADTPSEYLALVLDAKFEAFDLGDFRLNSVADASEAWALMQDPNESVAMAVLWEPYVTQARQQGYTVVLSGNDAPGTIVDVLVASDELLQSQPDVVSNLVQAYYRRIDANVRNAAQLESQIAVDGDLTPAEASAIVDGIDFFTSLEAKTWIDDGTLERRINSTAAVLTLTEELQGVPDNVTSLFTDRFVAQAAQNTETLIELVRADNSELAERLSGTTRSLVPTLSRTEIQTSPDIGNLDVGGDVAFNFGSAQLTAQGRQSLDQLSSDINEFNPETVAVRVIGHTSRTGPASVNQLLSQQRAQSVVDYFKQKRLPHNLVAEGRGFEQPLPKLEPNDPRNQRTKIRLVRVD